MEYPALKFSKVQKPKLTAASLSNYFLLFGSLKGQIKSKHILRVYLHFSYLVLTLYIF